MKWGTNMKEKQLSGWFEWTSGNKSVEWSVAKEGCEIRQKSEGKFEAEHQYSDSRMKYFFTC